MTADRHAVFAVLEDGLRVRLSPWLDWHTAIDRWNLADDVRRDLLGAGDAVVTNVRYFAVRAENDPDWNGSDHLPAVIFATEGIGAKDYKAPTRRVGAEHNLEGREGGWIYRNGQPINQGWHTFTIRYEKSGEIVSRREPGSPRRYYLNAYRHAIRTLRSPATDLATV